jgi:hypothetical protein
VDTDDRQWGRHTRDHRKAARSPAGRMRLADTLRHGLTDADLDRAVRAALAAATTERVAPGYRGERARLWITEAGRRALADAAHALRRR